MADSGDKIIQKILLYHINLMTKFTSQLVNADLKLKIKGFRQASITIG